AAQLVFPGRSRAHPRPGRPAGRSRCWPALEALEDRTVPSTLTVTNLFDDGDGSLRDQIAAAASGDTIVFDGSLRGTLILTGGELDITRNLTIRGPGAANLAVSGNNAQRVFHVGRGANVTISGLTIADGRVAGFGAGIESEGSLTLTNSTLTNNSADMGGGGVYFVVNSTGSASLTVSGSTFTNNRGANGAGLFSSVTNRSGSVTVSVTSTNFSDNVATGAGGAIDIFGRLSAVARATFTVAGGTFTNNRAASGGAIASILRTTEVSNGTATLSGTTILNNTATPNCGGVCNDVACADASQATATLSGGMSFPFTPVVLNANRATEGGGLYSTITSSDDGRVSLTLTGSLQITDNVATQDGGGV